ncbi:phosphoribosylglycinamide formyltransferase [Candidatus Micrarchaeota archaeon]|nr:phosphoribosylglycinamide formyltransferase [Candidatus Micrarchaeota archaeon]
MLKLGVIASGHGSNFQAIINAIENKELDAKIEVLITDNPDAYSIQRAKKHSIPIELIERKNFPTRIAFDEKIISTLKSYSIDLVVLAGYMRLLKSQKWFSEFPIRIINIHPALLPSFPGTHAQKDAFEYGVKISGCTVHFVDEGLDTGPIIAQRSVDISDCVSEEEVKKKILVQEHHLYKSVIKMFTKGSFRMEGRRVVYTQD